jgi:hypothetical protein
MINLVFGPQIELSIASRDQRELVDFRMLIRLE